MQIILQEDIDKLGHRGDVVTVKPGYARNFLLPQRKAMRATKESLAYFETQRAQLEAKEKLLRIRHITDYWRLEEPRGTLRWYFMTRNNVVKYLSVSEPLSLQLSTGALAIVERPEEVEEPRYVLIEREAAELVARVDSTYVCFHNTDIDGDDQ